MAEYYFNSHTKKWSLVDSHSYPVDNTCLIRNPVNRKNNFLKMRNMYNRYFITGEYTYIDLDDVKLIIDDTIYIEYKGNGCRTMQICKIDDVVNKEILKNIEIDPSSVISFMDDALYIKGTEKDEVQNWERHKYWLNKLPDTLRLVYDLEGNYPGKRYDNK